jgi:hypothetical protein
MNGKDFAIGVLSITAVILLTGLIILHAVAPQKAMAFGQNAGAGDYLVTTSQVNDYVELLIVMDTAQMKMNAYIYNVQTGQVDLLQPPIPVLRPPVAPARESEERPRR